MIYDDMNKQQKLAAMFRHMFSDAFEEAMDQGLPHFDLHKQKFDDWLVMTGETPEFPQVPDKGSRVEWSAWVLLRNQLRAQLNDAAEVGAHGEPPYRIDQNPDDKTLWRIHLLTGMIAVTFKDAAKSLHTLSKNKNKDISRVFEMLNKQTDQLPLEQRLLLRMQKKMFANAVLRVTRDMNELIGEIQGVGEEVQLSLANHSQQSALTHNPEE
jgi:hypothetical protein